MLTVDVLDVQGFGPAIRGMRNPMNSWDKSDSLGVCFTVPSDCCKCPFVDPENNGDDGTTIICNKNDDISFIVGRNDLDLMRRLFQAGTEHRKYARMIQVYLNVTAPLYWWKEFDTYKVGTVANSCSTMHKIHAKEFTMDDFSHEHLTGLYTEGSVDSFIEIPDESRSWYSPRWILENVIIKALNKNRDNYIIASEALKTRDLTDAERKHITAQKKLFWWQMIQLLPTSYNQTRTVMLSYENAFTIRRQRKNHKLDEWHILCDALLNLPYYREITGEE